MRSIKIQKPKCSDCSYHLIYTDSIPKKVKGAFLKFGYRYCTAGKAIRQFKKRDPKVYPASWCPITKNPAELRIYCYKDLNTAWLRRMLTDDGAKVSPSGYQYAVRYDGHVDLSAKEFYDAAQMDSPSDVLGIAVHCNEIIEIDDGHKPYYFYIPEISFVEPISFNSEIARKNQLEN